MSDNNIRARAHALTYAEWVRRFTAKVESALALTSAQSAHIVPAELESWPEEPTHDSSDWRDEQPEDAALENLSNWTE